MAVRAFVTILEASVDPDSFTLVEMHAKVNILGADREKFGTTGVYMRIPGIDPNLEKMSIDDQVAPVIQASLEKSGVVFQPGDTVQIY